MLEDRTEDLGNDMHIFTKLKNDGFMMDISGNFSLTHDTLRYVPLNLICVHSAIRYWTSSICQESCSVLNTQDAEILYKIYSPYIHGTCSFGDN